MKALTLTQPWATLVAIGAKRVETRSWATSYRGPLAIHAAKFMPRWAREEAYGDEIGGTLNAAGIYLGGDCRELPKGAVVATARLVEVIQVPPEGIDESECWMVSPEGPESPVRDCYAVGEELWFGDFSPGRYAWLLADVEALPEPIPAKGALRLWWWDMPARNGGSTT